MPVATIPVGLALVMLPPVLGVPNGLFMALVQTIFIYINFFYSSIGVNAAKSPHSDTFFDCLSSCSLSEFFCVLLVE